MDRKQVLAHQVWMLWLKETKVIICRPIFRQIIMHVVQCCFIPSQGENIITIFWFENYTAQSVWNLKSCCYSCKKNMVLMSYWREYSYSSIPPPTPLYSLSSFLALYIIFMKPQFFHMNLRFQKEKKWRNVVFTTTVICIYFTSLTLVCKLSFIQRILPETNMSPLISQMLAFLCALIILTIKIF